MTDIKISDITFKYLIDALNDSITKDLKQCPITESSYVNKLILNINDKDACMDNIIYFLNNSNDRVMLTNKLTELLIKVEVIIEETKDIKIYEFNKRLRSVIYSLIYKHNELWLDNGKKCNSNNIIRCYGLHIGYLENPIKLNLFKDNIVHNSINNKVEKINEYLEDYIILIRYLNNIFDAFNSKINIVEYDTNVKIKFSNDVLGINLIYLLNFMYVDISIEEYIKYVLQLFVIGTKDLIIFKYWYKFDNNLSHKNYIKTIRKMYNISSNIIINDIHNYLSIDYDDYNFDGFILSLKRMPNFRNKLYLKNYIKHYILPNIPKPFKITNNSVILDKKLYKNNIVYNFIIKEKVWVDRLTHVVFTGNTIIIDDIRDYPIYIKDTEEHAIYYYRVN